MAQLYDGRDFSLRINGQILNCRISFALPESVEVETSQRAGSWDRVRPNNQGVELDVTGLDFGAWAYLKSIKSIVTPISFDLVTNDGEISEQGLGWIVELTRGQTEGGDTNFSARIVATGLVENTTEFSYLLLENGDYILLEDAGRIKN